MSPAMNPLELVALTPKSNCGECGFPTCLAFAVAVTKGGAAASRCPHIESNSLPKELQAGQGDGLDRVAQGQQERDMALVAHLKSRIRPLDFQSLAPRLGAAVSTDGDALLFTYLGQKVELGRDELIMDGKQLVDPRDQILLYNYVAFEGGEPPRGNWLGMESLPNSISKVKTLATYCEQRIAERFTGRVARLKELCAFLGGREDSVEQSGDVCMVIPVLPHVPLLLLFWDEEPEDGFPAKVKVLFDSQVMDFLDLESLVFTAERLADRLAELDRA